MYKIGVIGDYDSISGFAALGFDVYPVEDIQAARGKLSDIAQNDYAVIFVTEQYFSEMADICAEYQAAQIPVITVVPTVGVKLNAGRGVMKKYVEKAVGSDIIFKEGI